MEEEDILTYVGLRCAWVETRCARSKVGSDEYVLCSGFLTQVRRWVRSEPEKLSCPNELSHV